MMVDFIGRGHKVGLAISMLVFCYARDMVVVMDVVSC